MYLVGNFLGTLPCQRKEMEMFSTFEPIVDLNKDHFAKEILFRLNAFNNSHVIVLKELRARKQTFMLFTRICAKAFDEAKNTGNIIHVNLEVQDLLNTNFLYFLDTLLSYTGINPSLINFELLETEKITPEIQDRVFLNLKILNEMGFLLSIDDLFSGFSTKRRVNNILSNGISLHMVKLDGKFFQDAYLSSKYGYDNLINVNDIEGLNTYIEGVKSIGVKVLAEWIESEDMFDYAKSLGVEYFQGYHFQNPKHKELHRI
ncbi:MAG: EAL domain-containing protein [Candidatus Gracilibacteria bacterium]|nr:EAL domain-containing protein [Candidatus Gracilibacteria bacterium]